MSERWCNLSLPREHWLAFVACLRRTGQPQCVRAAAAIEAELGDQERHEMYRELEKWEQVFTPAYSRAKKPEMNAMAAIITQLSAAKLTQVW